MATDGTCTIQSNPDVTGIGIRISIYILALSSSFVAEVTRSASLRSSFQSSMGISGLALLFTAIVQSARHQLSLLHAICVMHLLALLGITISPKAGWGARTFRSAFILNIILYCAAVAMFVGWVIYVWATADTFGNECNDETIFVIFGINIQATTPGLRWAWVGVCGSIIAGIIVSAAITSCISWISTDPNRRSTWNYSEDSSASGKASGFPWYLLGELAVVSYTISMLELTIQRNPLGNVAEEREWTFGQTISMFLLLGPLIELLGTIVKKLRDVND